MLRQISISFIICFSSFCALAQTQTVEISEPMKLSMRPQPVYTGKAREKKVEGTVRLKVTFLASGEIGEVIYVSESSKKKKLTKYGLVQQAIEAAKKIRFEPAKKNGQPISVVKLIEYSFTIY